MSDEELKGIVAGPRLYQVGDYVRITDDNTPYTGKIRRVIRNQKEKNQGVRVERPTGEEFVWKPQRLVHATHEESMAFEEEKRNLNRRHTF